MWMVYRANGVVNGGTRIYERAFKAQPHREDFAQQAFCGHVREGAYQKQGQVHLAVPPVIPDSGLTRSTCAMAARAQALQGL